jgi:hypothetical protein
MHEMDRTPKIVTIIGLVLEGLGAISSFISGLFLVNFENSPFYDLIVTDIPADELDEMVELISWLGSIAFALGIGMTIIFIVNVYLFSKLIRNQFTEEQAKKVYLYQAIWGGFSILFNTITGILYLISGVTGYSGYKEERNIRDGI